MHTYTRLLYILQLKAKYLELRGHLIFVYFFYHIMYTYTVKNFINLQIRCHTDHIILVSCKCSSVILYIKTMAFEKDNYTMWLLDLNQPILDIRSGRKMHRSGQQLSILFQNISVTKEATMKPQRPNFKTKLLIAKRVKALVKFGIQF